MYRDPERLGFRATVVTSLQRHLAMPDTIAKDRITIMLFKINNP